MDAALKDFCSYVLSIRGEDNKRLIDKVKTYIEGHYAENISLSRLAAYASTTPEFLSNIFHEAEGKSVYQYAISVRMRNALRLFKETFKSVEEVAAAVGYDDVKHFKAVFTQYQGINVDAVRGRKL
jgi:two-component system response regulator YesN